MMGEPCAECGQPIPADAPRGLCPPCLVPLSLTEELPSHIGEYAIIERLGEGGSGVVYLARQERPPHLRVALKVMRAGEFADEREVTRFLSEVESQGRLKHPNIVQIYDGRGLDHGAPFFVMQHVDGGTLADARHQAYFSAPVRAAELMIVVARAIQFAHEAGVLHLDVKPANILLDAQRRPYVGDFSIAQRLHGAEALGEWDFAGSLGYMPPELLSGDQLAVSTMCDVFGLGATLYELLTGRVPYDADDLVELRARFQGSPAVTPRELADGVGAGLARVCLGAIERDPRRRYRSAAAFADDLERAIDQRPTAPPNLGPPPLWGRALLWARRHPLLAAAATAFAALLMAGDALSYQAALLHETQLIEATLRGNAALATVKANDVLAVFDEDTARVRRAAAAPEVRAYLAGGTDLAARALEPFARGFSSVFVVAPDGRVRARWPPLAQQAYYDVDFSKRDYFRGARALGVEGQVYLSSAFHSSASSDDRLKFAFATPLCAADGSLLGVLVATRTAASSLRDVQIDELFGNGQITTLLGPHEPADLAASDTPSFDVLIHERLASTAEYPVEPRIAARLLQAASASSELFVEADYRDPVPGFAGRWLAGFAVVTGTRYVVVVQSSAERALAPTRRLLWSLTIYALVLHAAVLLLALWTIGSTLLRRSEDRRRPSAL